MRILKEKTIRFPRKRVRIVLAKPKTTSDYRIYKNRKLWEDKLDTKKEAKEAFKKYVKWYSEEAEKDWKMHRTREWLRKDREKKRRRKKRREKLHRLFGGKKKRRGK